MERSIRVFISSTFRDMQAERDELVKYTFPRLRKLCDQRSVSWSEVDLRWGITDEKQGEVLPICLKEIHNCRPYFIGILGERYGWIPDQIPEELLEQEQWLGGHQSQSITELEILHGVLNDPEMSKTAFFYFRDPAYIKHLNIEERSNFQEIPTDREIITWGKTLAEQMASERADKLEQLKNRIRNSGYPLRENYPDPQALGELVYQDLVQVIDSLFPPGSQPDALDREAAEHETFAQARIKVYLKREADFFQLNEHLHSCSGPLVITSPSGCGKSALLANWAQNYQKNHPQAIIIQHYIGATNISSDWAMLVRRLMAEFNRHFDLQLTFPLDPIALRTAFTNSLFLVAQKGDIVLILDGLDHLEESPGAGARELLWLPARLPPNVHLLLSTTPGPALEEAQRRDWGIMNLQEFSEQESANFIETYLGTFAKQLNPAQVDRICNNHLSRNPLFLKVLLEELRQFGVHELLDQQINHYLQVGSIPKLFDCIFERFEKDYQREHPELVRETLTRIWAARRGLSEHELLKMMGNEQGPLPHAFWSPLFLALEPFLIIRSGLIGFFHNFFSLAVQDRYLTTLELQAQAHDTLAKSFMQSEEVFRKLDELPWQLSQANDWKNLADLLSQPSFFNLLWQQNEYDAKAFWAQVELNSSRRMVSDYQMVLDTPKNYPETLRPLARLFQAAGHTQKALILQEALLEFYDKQGDRAYYSSVLGDMAYLQAGSGLYKNAAELYQCEAAILQETGDIKGQVRAMFNLANLLKMQGETQRALLIYQDCEQFWRQNGDLRSLSQALGNRGNILRDLGEMADALALFKEKEHLCWQLGEQREYARAIESQATVHMQQGDFLEALNLLHKEEQILRGLGEISSLPTCLGNQAIVKQELGHYEEALAIYREHEQLCRQMDDRRGLAEAFGRQGTVFLAQREYNAAMDKLQQQEKLCRELDIPDELQVSLGNQAMIWRAAGNLDQALRLQREKEKICRELGNQKALAIALGNIGNIYADRREFKLAMQYYQEKETLDRKLGNKSGLEICLGNQARLLISQRLDSAALQCLKEQEQVCRAMNHPEKIARCLITQAKLMVQNLNQTLQALPLVQEAYHLTRDSQDRELTSQVEMILSALRNALA